MLREKNYAVLFTLSFGFLLPACGPETADELALDGVYGDEAAASTLALEILLNFSVPDNLTLNTAGQPRMLDAKLLTYGRGNTNQIHLLATIPNGHPTMPMSMDQQVWTQ